MSLKSKEEPKKLIVLNIAEKKTPTKTGDELMETKLLMKELLLMVIAENKNARSQHDRADRQKYLKLAERWIQE